MMRVQPELIRRTVEALLLEHPEVREDEDLRITAIEGETDTFELLAIALDDIREAQMMRSAITEHIEALRARATRFERREEFQRKLVLRIMEAAKLCKAVLPQATLSVRPAPRAVRIINQAFIPDPFWRVKREPDLSQIKAALKAGTDVPGAALSNAPDTLAILTR